VSIYAVLAIVAIIAGLLVWGGLAVYKAGKRKGASNAINEYKNKAASTVERINNHTDDGFSVRDNKTDWGDLSDT
jgi:hypothetical protein